MPLLLAGLLLDEIGESDELSSLLELPKLIQQNMMKTSYRLLTGMWPMPAPMWWLSYQRTSVPVSASATAPQASLLPRLSREAAGCRMNMPAQ